MADFDHWMKFHVGDYLADTMHLSTFQHGIYVLLIMHYFKRGELPSDDASLCRIAKVHPPLWKRYSGPVMALFKRDHEGRVIHTRIDALRDEARQLSRKRADAGKSGAYKRHGVANATGDDSNCQRFANDLLDVCQPTRARVENQSDQEKGDSPSTPFQESPLNPPSGEGGLPSKSNGKGSEHDPHGIHAAAGRSDPAAQRTSRRHDAAKDGAAAKRPSRRIVH